MTTNRLVNYIILGLIASFILLIAIGYARAQQGAPYIVERYTTGTAKIIELHERLEDVQQVFQVGRPRAQCEGFRVLTGEQRNSCVVIYNDQNPRRR